MPPRELAPPSQRLPPMLHSLMQSSITSCSKGAWGLFVCRGDSESSPRLLFRRARGRDSTQVVTPFVQVGTYPTRNFATLGPLSLRPPFTGASDQSFALRLTSPLNLPAPGRSQCVYGALCGLARTCVFAKQSLESILCGPVEQPEQVWQPDVASLLPKLRDHYAEFLDHVSLVHLRLLA